VRRLAVLALLAAPARAWAKPPAPPAPPVIDEDTEDDSGDDGFWLRILHPNHERFHALYARAQALADVGQSADAESVLQQAVLLEPDDAPARALLAHVQYKLSQFKDCAASFAQLDELAPTFDQGGRAPVDYHAARCAAQSGDFAMAIDRFQKVLAGKPAGLEDKISLVHLRLGDAFEAVGQLEDALREYQTAVSSESNSALFHFELAVALDRDEEIERAHAEALTALRLDQQMNWLTQTSAVYLDPADRDYFLGLAHEVGRAEGFYAAHRLVALAAFRAYLASDPSTPWARRARDHLAGLGSPQLTEDDVLAKADFPQRAAFTKVILAAGREMQKCITDGKSGALLTIIDDARNHPTSRFFTQQGIDNPDQNELRCMQDRLDALKLPQLATGSVQLSVAVVAP
jgi:tetratricopeptide (TPR) repeat protein